MATIRANVRTPWAQAGETFETDDVEKYRHHLDNLVLTLVEEPTAPEEDEEKTEPKKRGRARKAVVVEEGETDGESGSETGQLGSDPSGVQDVGEGSGEDR